MSHLAFVIELRPDLDAGNSSDGDAAIPRRKRKMLGEKVRALEHESDVAAAFQKEVPERNQEQHQREHNRVR